MFVSSAAAGSVFFGQSIQIDAFCFRQSHDICLLAEHFSGCRYGPALFLPRQPRGLTEQSCAALRVSDRCASQFIHGYRDEAVPRSHGTFSNSEESFTRSAIACLDRHTLLNRNIEIGDCLPVRTVR